MQINAKRACFKNFISKLGIDVEDEGHGRVSVEVGWNDCGFPEPSTSLERSLPTGRLMLSFKQMFGTFSLLFSDWDSSPPPGPTAL